MLMIKKPTFDGGRRDVRPDNHEQVDDDKPE